MFGDAAVHSFPPEAKTRRLQLAAHDGYDFQLDEAGALLDFLKARSVLPSQPHNPGNLLGQKSKRSVPRFIAFSSLFLPSLAVRL